jgi:hypothetical protein
MAHSARIGHLQGSVVAGPAARKPFKISYLLEFLKILAGPAQAADAVHITL